MNYTFSVTYLDWINKNELRGNKIDQRKYFTSTETKWSLLAESYLREIYADEKLKYNAELKFLDTLNGRIFYLLNHRIFHKTMVLSLMKLY